MAIQPDPDEFHPYFARYVSLVPDGDIIDILLKQHQLTLALFRSLSESESLTRYEPDKWSVKQIAGHLADTERIMTYRLLCAARGESVPLPGFNQDDYVRNADFDKVSWTQLLTQLAAVRHATLTLLPTIQDEAWKRKVPVWDHPTSTRALITIVAGHERHHQSVFQERYLPAVPKR